VKASELGCTLVRNMILRGFYKQQEMTVDRYSSGGKQRMEVIGDTKCGCTEVMNEVSHKTKKR
jgi:hypothetical protein